MKLFTRLLRQPLLFLAVLLLLVIAAAALIKGPPVIAQEQEGSVHARLAMQDRVAATTDAFKPQGGTRASSGMASLSPARLASLPAPPMGAPMLVKDINTNGDGGGSSPSFSVYTNGKLFFTGADLTYGSQLWVSDGTAAGTLRITDRLYLNSWARAINGTLFFAADDGVNGFALWKSDGTAAGTMLVKDISPFGSNGGCCDGTPHSFAEVNGTLYFAADDGVHGYELWKSDGTAAGTVMVKDIFPGAGASIFAGSITNVGATNTTLLFVANDSVHGLELWKTDGTAAGTVLVKDINPGSNNGVGFLAANVNGVVYFLANDGVHGSELWKSDGTTAGTVLVKDIRPGNIFSSEIHDIVNVNGTLFFRANDGVNGFGELWKSDGTEAGTVLVKNIYPGSSGAGVYMYGATNVNGVLFFSDGNKLWKSDGTEVGTVVVSNINLFPNSFLNVNGVLYFWASDGAFGRDLWKSDGTMAGTVLVKDITPVNGYDPGVLMVNRNGGQFFFWADDGVQGRELWKSDGTAAGTVLVKNIAAGNGNAPFEAFGIANTRPVCSNGTFYFSATDGINGAELWKSDGSAAGTTLVKDIFPGSSSSGPYNLTDVNGTLFFLADDGVHGIELWKSNGTAAGTVLVKEIAPGGLGIDPEYSSFIFSRAFMVGDLNGVLLFSASDDGGTYRLWRSDGTEAGTFLLKNIYPNLDNFNPYFVHRPTIVNGVLYFAAFDLATGNELWKTDGTAAGTVLVKDIASGTGLEPRYLTNVNGTIYFFARNETREWAMWRSDGTATGTTFIQTLSTNVYEPPLNLINVNGTLFFTTDNNRRLWKSDGTAAGTVVIKEFTVSAGVDFGYFIDMAVINGVLYFTTYADTGNELWRTDGTTAGTVLVKDIFPGLGNSFPREFVLANNELYFTANDGTHGRELWKSDGTAAGTMMVADLTGDAGSSSPSHLTVCGTKLFFYATTETTGTELYSLELPPTLTYPANPRAVYGAGMTLHPLTRPGEGAGVTSIVVQSITPSNPGGITVNSAGVVTVANTVPAGTYTVTIRVNAAGGNSDASFTLDIARAPLRVTVNNAWRNFNTANPPLSGTITGLQSGDVITASYSTTATITSPAGTYPITATLNDPGGRLGNYNVTNTPGTLTIVTNCGAAISPLTLPPAALAQIYAAGLTVVALSSATAGPYSFSLVAGSLPPGLTLVNTVGVFSLQGVPTTPGTYTFTLLATRVAGGCSRAITYTITIAPSVVPIAECIINNGNGTFTARFGYENTTGGVVTIPVGLNNMFSVGAQNRSQPTVFQVGRVTNAFTVTFQTNGSDASSWLLRGPDNVLRSVILNATALACP